MDAIDAEQPMKKYLLYNTLLNIGLVLMIFSAVAAYNSNQLLFLGISILIAIFLVYTKYSLLKRVRQMTNEDK